MNERIRELAKQAGIKITPMIVDDIEYEYEDVEMDGSEDLAKFAELIVQECVSKIGDEYKDALDYVMEDWDRGFLGGLSCAMDTVQKHFGVEE